MSGTALYRALVHAGAPEDEAKEASEAVDNTSAAIDKRLNSLETAVAELKATSKLNLAVSLIILLFILKLSFA